MLSPQTVRVLSALTFGVFTSQLTPRKWYLFATKSNYDLNYLTYVQLNSSDSIYIREITR